MCAHSSSVSSSSSPAKSYAALRVRLSADDPPRALPPGLSRSRRRRNSAKAADTRSFRRRASCVSSCSSPRASAARSRRTERPSSMRSFAQSFGRVTIHRSPRTSTNRARGPSPSPSPSPSPRAFSPSPRRDVSSSPIPSSSSSPPPARADRHARPNISRTSDVRMFTRSMTVSM